MKRKWWPAQKKSAELNPICLVYAFVWPPGKKFVSDFDAETKRRDVRYYINCMIQSIKNFRSSDFLIEDVIVHMHPNCEYMEEKLSQVLESKVTFAYCKKEDHWRFPVFMKSSTLLNHPSNEHRVVMMDVHDKPEDQMEMMRTLSGEMVEKSKHAAFTFWPYNYDPNNPIDQHRPSQGVTRREHKVIDNPQKNGRFWWVDCGFAISTPHFRQLLGGKDVGESSSGEGRGVSVKEYERFLREDVLPKYNNVWKDFEALSDEAALDLYLFKQNYAIAETVKCESVISPHWLRVEDDLTEFIHEMESPRSESWSIPPDSDGSNELLIPAQLIMIPDDIKKCKLKWQEEGQVLTVRKKPKLTNNTVVLVVLDALKTPPIDDSLYKKIGVNRTYDFDSILPIEDKANGFEYGNMYKISVNDIESAWRTPHATVLMERLQSFYYEFPQWYQGQYPDARSGTECQIVKGKFRPIQSVERTNAVTAGNTICYSCPLETFPKDIEIGDVLELNCVEKLPFGMSQEQFDSAPEQIRQALTRDEGEIAPPQFWTHTYPLWLWKAHGINSNIRLEVHVPAGIPCLVQDLYMKSYRTKDGQVRVFKTIGFGACSMRVTQINSVKGFIFNPDVTIDDVKCITCELLKSP